MNIRIVLRVIVCGLVVAFIGQAGADQSAQLHSQRVFKIGVLATLTGSGFTLGQDTVAALQIAEEQLEADAIVALMQHDVIQAIAPLWRNDAGNDGLHDSVKAQFEARGGTVTQGFQYEPTTTDFSAATSSIASQITNLQGGGTQASTIAVYLAAFDEVVDVFHNVQSNPNATALLPPRHWYGSDGVALSAALTGDANAATFAASVDYPNPTFGLPDSLQSEWQPISDEIEARTGIKPDA